MDPTYTKKSFFYGLTLFVLCLFFSTAVQAQGLQAGEQNFTDLHPDSVIRINPFTSKFQHVPGQLLVKFRDEVTINVIKSNNLVKTGITGVDVIFERFAVTGAEQLFPHAAPVLKNQMLTAPNGTQFERPCLHNIYLLKSDAESHQIFELMGALNQNPAVVYAEPNFIYSLVGAEPLSPEMTEEEMLQWVAENLPGQAQQKTAGLVPNDPLYSQQWGIPVTQVDRVWNTTTGSNQQIIAILDTGVDWNHPDLADNIWSNLDEMANNRDTDGNGFADDIRGWDFINNDNNPMDDNSHGTHVAGIAAARGNNGIGIAGISWNARIMPVKVLQSSGRGDVATIARGITYAANNGATVINMSFGGYARSLTMEQALANAYASAVLVAAAGNDGICIGPDGCFNAAPFFPAALSFVLGIETPAGFSNRDQDGPVFSKYPELWNYELSAPGVDMISTIPHGGYRVFSGTSMAAPMVSGAVAIYKTIRPDHSQELMWANLIHSSSAMVKIQDAIIGITNPRLAIVSTQLIDNFGGGDGDGIPDAGETIRVWANVRNTGVQANQVKVGIRLSEFEDPSVAQITSSTATLGSISPFATRTNQVNPLEIRIASTVANDRDIAFELFTYNEGQTDTIFQPLLLTAENGVNLVGMIGDTLILTPDKRWIVSGSFKLTRTGVMIIKPGTHLQINSKIINEGQIIGMGTRDSLIYISGGPIWAGTVWWTQNNPGYISLNYANVNNSFIDNTSFSGAFNNLRVKIRNSIVTLSTTCYTVTAISGEISESILRNWAASWADFFWIEDRLHIKNSNLENFLDHFTERLGRLNNISFENVNFVNIPRLHTPTTHWGSVPNFLLSTNNFIQPKGAKILETATVGDFQHLPGQYWGTADSAKIESMIYDFLDNASHSRLIFSPFLRKPSELTNPIVWKVLVNGRDAQDEVVDPVGVGRHRFDVYFNRAMDTLITPRVSFGVRHPFIQQTVNEDGRWSEDGKIYTVYKTVRLTTGDGINRIRVAGAKGLNGWEIPIEDMRFEFLIDAAGAASEGFMATPGLGKIRLEWGDMDLEDALGINLYRMEHINDSILSQPILVNNTLILDSLFTDFNVVPGRRYYYYYKILRTNMAETDSSRVVSAIPLTAALGDANGDFAVNVIDIVTIVSNMLRKNPQPFIFEAADVNADKAINVLDIVGVVQIINRLKSLVKQDVVPHPETAYISLDNQIIRIESSGQLTGLQFEIHTAFPELVQLSAIAPGFELAWTRTEQGIFALLFSMQGNTIPAGLADIIRIEHRNPDLQWGTMFGATPDGRMVEIKTKPLNMEEEVTLPMEFTLNVFPNPARDNVTISYFLPGFAEVQIQFIDVFGRQLDAINYARQAPGQHTLTISLAALNLPPGVTFCRVTAKGPNGIIFQKTVKILLIK